MKKDKNGMPLLPELIEVNLLKEFSEGQPIVDETEKLQFLIDHNYKVEVVNPRSNMFNEKYAAYKDLPFGRRYAVLNEVGDVIGSQG